MGKIICVGLGPGDPDLMSVRADRLIRGATQIAYFRKKGNKGQARQIVEGMLGENVVEYPMEYPMTTEIPFQSAEYNKAHAAFYNEWAQRIIELSAKDDLIVLCEGDPLFYGSYMHLQIRIADQAEQVIIPAITGMTGCWNAVGEPMTWGDDVHTTLMGTLPEDVLVQHIKRAHAISIMKTGKNITKIARALESAGRLEDAWLVKYGTMANQVVEKLKGSNLDDCPYFATVIVQGKGRRP